MSLDSFNASNPYRRFINGAKTPVFFDYGGYPPPIVDPTAPAPTPAPAVDPGVPAPPPLPVFAPPRPMALPPTVDGSVSNGISSGVTGQGASTGGVSVGPSSVNGTGIGSIASNIGLGSTQGMIAAAMGLIGLAPGPASTISGIASLANSMGLNGVTNGIAVSNDQSSNNVANDVGAIEGLANAMGIGPNSSGPVGVDAANSSPSPDASGTVGVADTGTNANSAVGVADSGTSDGDGFARGGRAYHRFVGGGRVDRHPVPRSMDHLYRQFKHRQLTPTY